MKLKSSFKVLLENKTAMAGLIVIISLILLAFFAPILAPYSPTKINLEEKLSPPSLKHPLGTDELGRDILSRIIWGSRIDLYVGFISISIASLIGSLVGLTSGYTGRWVDEVLMRVTDVFLSFPALILAMAIAATLGPSLTNMMIAVSLVWWPSYARVVRSETLKVKEQLYVEAARSIGCSDLRIIFIHILPNCLPSILVLVTMDLGGAILAASGLSFIGFGAQPPTPEWGLMISTAYKYALNNWWVATFPGLAILTVALGFNLLGDGIRDLLEPKLRYR